MAKYSIQDTTLVSIGDAIRNKTGEHTRIEYGPYIEIIPAVTVSKTPNATGFDSHKGSFSNQTLYDVVRIPGASSIYVDIAVEVYLWSGKDHVEIVAGEYNESNFPTGTGEKVYSKDQNNKLIRKQITIPNTDVITVKFITSASHDYLGYYAECSGIDADGQPIGDRYVEVVGEHEVKNTLTPAQMAEEIAELSLVPAEALTLTGDCSYRFANDGWNWFINQYGDKITTKDIKNLQYFANKAIGLTKIPFDINIHDTLIGATYCFGECTLLIEVPQIVGQIKSGAKLNIENMFRSCSCLKEIPYDYFHIFGGVDYWQSTQELSSSSGRSYLFAYCTSLRKLPDISMLKNKMTYYSCLYNALCQNCYSLDSIDNLPIIEAELTGNALGNTAIRCSRLKSLTFETNEDGSPKTAQWKSQNLILSDYTGYCSSANKSFMINDYGNSAEKEIVDSATYQALKDDPDSWTAKEDYSRYNKLSAIETINSLPDTSAYGTNTITFKGAAGALTDGGAINTLTEEEIAVAAAKGWTVSFK